MANKRQQDPTADELFLWCLKNDGKGQIFFPHNAFRSAVLKFKKENPNPAYWAALSVLRFVFDPIGRHF